MNSRETLDRVRTQKIIISIQVFRIWHLIRFQSILENLPFSLWSAHSERFDSIIPFACRYLFDILAWFQVRLPRMPRKSPGASIFSPSVASDFPRSRMPEKKLQRAVLAAADFIKLSSARRILHNRSSRGRRRVSRPLSLLAQPPRRKSKYWIKESASGDPSSQPATAPSAADSLIAGFLFQRSRDQFASYDFSLTGPWSILDSGLSKCQRGLMGQYLHPE